MTSRTVNGAPAFCVLIYNKLCWLGPSSTGSRSALEHRTFVLATGRPLGQFIDPAARHPFGHLYPSDWFGVFGSNTYLVGIAIRAGSLQ